MAFREQTFLSVLLYCLCLNFFAFPFFQDNLSIGYSEFFGIGIFSVVFSGNVQRQAFTDCFLSAFYYTVSMYFDFIIIFGTNFLISDFSYETIRFPAAFDIFHKLYLISAFFCIDGIAIRSSYLAPCDFYLAAGWCCFCFVVERI